MQRGLHAVKHPSSHVCAVIPLVSLNYNNIVSITVDVGLLDLSRCFVEFSVAKISQFHTLLSLWFQNKYMSGPCFLTFPKVYSICNLEFWQTINFYYLPTAQKNKSKHLRRNSFVLKIDKISRFIQVSQCMEIRTKSIFSISLSLRSFHTIHRCF